MIIEKDLRGSFSGDRFCHQFILGPKFIDSLVGWQKVDVSESLKLTLHPEVTVERLVDGDKSITVIGHILDPQSPKASNFNIAQDLLDNFSKLDDVINQTARYGGRWIIIAKKNKHSFLFNDALGLRQVFSTTPDFEDGLWCVSQPGLLAWLYDLKVDSDAERFIDSCEFRRNPEYRWPGVSTAFREITHLLPNHYLDLYTGKHHRFWPNEQLKRVSFDEGVEKATRVLRGMMKAAYYRFDLVIGMTAGIDSRIVLAASKEMKDNLAAITVRQGRMQESHQDVRIASRLLGRMGIPHKIFKSLPFMSAEFSMVYKRNVFLAHDHYGPDVESILDYFSRDKAVATGSGLEVTRGPYSGHYNSDKVEFTANDLARLQNMSGNKYAIKYFEHWLEDVGNLYNVGLLELFSWEQGHGNWLAGTQMEFDLAWKDLFTPFNCRDLLVCLLSVDKQYRESPEYRIYLALIKGMWPELLQDPINPDDNEADNRSKRAREWIKKAIKKVAP